MLLPKYYVPERLHTILQIKGMPVDRFTILILHLRKDGNFQDSDPAQHFNSCLTFSGTIYKGLSFARPSKSAFALSIMDQQSGNEI